MPEIEYINEATDIPSIQMVQISSVPEPTVDGLIQVAITAAGAFFRRYGQAAIRLLTELDLVNLTFPTGARIKGDFSNGTAISRTLIQDSGTNTQTSVGAIPSGTSTIANWAAYNNSDPTNSAFASLQATASHVTINSGVSGSGTQLPMLFRLAGVVKGALATNGFWGFNTESPTALIDINSDILRLRVSKTPTSATDTGNQGDFCWDANYFYICVANDTWKRIALASW
jgi:hypothetical protein